MPFFLPFSLTNNTIIVPSIPLYPSDSPLQLLPNTRLNLMCLSNTGHIRLYGMDQQVEHRHNALFMAWSLTFMERPIYWILYKYDMRCYEAQMGSFFAVN